MTASPTRRERPARGIAAAPNAVVRPYVMTRGRTTVDGDVVAIEAMVVTVATPAERAGLTFEHADVAEACIAPISVAEIALNRRFPVGVVRVIVGDLRNRGIVRVSEPHADDADDIAFLQRLIDGVRAL